MTTYLVLLRGINVGGKNKVPMAQLRELLEGLGFSDVATYIASGNVVLRSDRPAAEIKSRIEEALPKAFRLDSDLIAVHVLTHAQVKAVIDKKPDGFGDQPDTYHSDAVFLMGIDSKAAMEVFDPRDGVDAGWPGEGVVYSPRQCPTDEEPPQQDHGPPAVQVDDDPQLGDHDRTAPDAGAVRETVTRPAYASAPAAMPIVPSDMTGEMRPKTLLSGSSR